MILTHDIVDKDLPFWRKVWTASGPNSCWEWQGALRNGYGCCGHALAHRHSYELAIGPVPDGLQINHRCNNPRCVNPSHLYAGTQAQNMADKVACGHMNFRKKFLTSEIVLEMRKMGATHTEVAAKYGISKSHAKNILNYTRWPTITVQASCGC